MKNEEYEEYTSIVHIWIVSQKFCNFLVLKIQFLSFHLTLGVKTQILSYGLKKKIFGNKIYS